LREASAFRLPAVFIENATASEDIIDGKNGFIAANSSNAFADKIMEIMKNKNRLSIAGKGAYDSFYRTWEQTVDEVAERYKAIIKTYKTRKLSE
jgi:glycosyltransferase involved in cell wall biosynthesis